MSTTAARGDGRMRFGVNLLNFGPGAGPESLRTWAGVAEGLGYDALLISDHVAVTPDVADQYPAPLYEPLTALAYLAAVTERIHLGTTVLIVPYRHPLLTAKVTANIDQLSGGRLVLGVGVGWARQEYDALGVPFARRGDLTDEYLTVLKALWTRDVVSHDGAFVRFAGVQSGPRPVARPHPPLWVGGWSGAAKRRAVRLGDAWHPLGGTLRAFGDGMEGLRAVAESEQRPVPAFVPRINLRLSGVAQGEDRLAGEGTVDQVRQDLAALRDMGAESVVFDTYLGASAEQDQHRLAWSLLERLADEVIDLGTGTVR